MTLIMFEHLTISYTPTSDSVVLKLKVKIVNASVLPDLSKQLQY